MPAPLTHYRFQPHSISDRAYWNAKRAEPRFAPVWAEIERDAESAPARPPHPEASDYLAARRSNDRNRLDKVWTERRFLSALALRRCALGLEDGPPDEKLLDWLWAYLTHPTWAVSAHLPEKDLPASGEPTLDLAACELAATFAELLEILKPWVDAQSRTLAGTIVREIDARVLGPYADGVSVWWDHRDGGLNNWCGVCAGSILAACESLAQQGLPRPQARERALEALALFVEQGFTPHGECDEGIGYWNYGVGFSCLGWSRLEQAEFERRVNLPRVKRIADDPRRAHFFGNTFFSGNDAGAVCRADLSFVPWLAAATGDTWLPAWGRAYPSYGKGHLGLYLRVLETPPLDEAGDLASCSGAAQFLDDQQVAILRTPTPRGEMIAALTGGHNAERHNHNDLGHYQITLGEEIVVPDLGAPRYMADFFGPKRYTYVSASSRGHNCPLIDEIEQRQGRDAAGKVLAWTPEAEIPRLVLDLTAAYPPEAGLKSWTRSLERWTGKPEQGIPARMVITDVFVTAKPNARVLLPMWTLFPFTERHQRPEGGGVTLQVGPLFAELSPSPVAVGKHEFDPEEFILRQWAGRKLYRVDAVYRTDAEGRLKTETRFFALAPGE